jgi:uncharacterized protein YbjQ (UPF0145 family)
MLDPIFLLVLRILVGGELVGYSKLLASSREQAYSRMLEDAKAKGANAIVCFRFQTFNDYTGGIRNTCVWYWCKNIKGKNYE